MANTSTTAAGAIASKMPPHEVNSASELKSTPLALGSAAVIEHIIGYVNSSICSAANIELRHARGVNDVCSWIARDADIDNYRKCDADAMLQELLCGFDERPNSEKSKLLQDSLKAVLDICNNTEEITVNLTRFASYAEPNSYPSFVCAANTALLKLSSLEVSRLPAPPHDNETGILFHYNDNDMKQMHQDAKSRHKPDVVLVSRSVAKSVAEGGEGKDKDKGQGSADKNTENQNQDAKLFYTNKAANMLHGNFTWIDVRPTVEFKHNHTLAPPVLPYKVTEYAPPKPGFKYLDLWNGTENSGPTSVAPTLAAAPARSSNKPSNEPQGTRASERLKVKSDNKCKSDQSCPNKSACRGLKKTGENRADQKEPKKKKPQRIHPNVRDGLYVAEIFAASIALQYVIPYVGNNDIIYIWYFDREDVIQCTNINFIRDIPRFFVLLLAMQRMGDVLVQSKYLSDKKRDVCDNDTNELVAKLYCPEEQRQSEESTAKGSIPDLVWFCKFNETSTGKIRRSLGVQDPDAERGSRVLCIIVSRKLIPITSLSRDEFISAWWQVVLCHHTLWKHDIHHGNVSLGSLMVYWLNGQWIGVLNDYDLSSIECDAPSSKERTGTIQFMAIDLLVEGTTSGKVTRLYRHDAESLVWVLVWACLRYEGGKLMSNGRLLDDWLKVGTRGRGEKCAFILKFRHGNADLEQPSPSHQSNWKIAVSCLRTIFRAPEAQADENETILQTWLLDNVESVAPDIIVRHPVNLS